MDPKPNGLTRYDCPKCQKRYFLAFATDDKTIQCRACRTQLVRHDPQEAKEATAGSN